MEEIAQAVPCSVEGQEALQLICKQRSAAGVRQVPLTLPGLVGCVEAARHYGKRPGRKSRAFARMG